MKPRAGISKRLGMLPGLILILVIAALAQKTPSVKTIELPDDNAVAKLQPGAGADTTEANCMGCHSTDYIVRQPGSNAEQWQAEVNKMIKTYGAPISEEDAKVITDYLASVYGRAPTDRPSAKPPRPDSLAPKAKAPPRHKP
ncbi:MAG: cytochrome c [Terriglobia bacterium]